MLRTIRRPTVLFAIALGLGLATTSAASSTAAASTNCKSGLVDGGRLSALVVSGAGCTTARNVQTAFHACIVRRNGRGLRRCESKVLNELLSSLKVPRYTCSERRRQHARNVTGQVSCKRGSRTVRYSYDLPFGA